VRPVTAHATAAVDRVEVVADVTGIDAGVPERRADVATRRMTQESLRDAQLVAQLRGVEPRPGAFDPVADYPAGFAFRRNRLQHGGRVDPQLLQHRKREARIGLPVIVGLEIQVATALPTAVDVDIDPILPGDDRVAATEYREVQLLAGDTGQESGVEPRGVDVGIGL